MSKASDQLHIQKVLDGDKDAFRYFIMHYQNMAFRIAYSMAQDEERAKLIVQNAFIQAYKGLPNFKLEAEFSTWLYRIVVNEAIKLNRKSKMDQHTVPITRGNTISLRTNNGALAAMELEEKRTQINRALSSMKPKESLIIELFYLQEKSVAEIEQITGFSNGNVKVLLHRARKSFAAIFTLTK